MFRHLGSFFKKINTFKKKCEKAAAAALAMAAAAVAAVAAVVAVVGAVATLPHSLRESHVQMPDRHGERGSVKRRKKWLLMLALGLRVWNDAISHGKSHESRERTKRRLRRCIIR